MFETESKFSFRPLTFSKSSSAGMGKFGTTYLGDIESNTANMGFSVTSTMSNSILGMPLTGADVCGSIGPPQAELCARWYTVAAFQPFSRNHKNIGYASQEPWAFNQVYLGTITYFDIIQNAMYTKLHLIRYFNTQLTRI
jgi:alpha-glucosidase